MAFHTRKQFADAAGKKAASVTMAVKRRQIIMSGDFIDDTIEKNKKLLERWQQQEAAKIAKPVIVDVPDVVIEEPKLKAPTGIREPKEEPKPKAPKGIKAPKETSIHGLDEIKKQAEIDLKIAQIERTNLQNQKLRGDSIPTEMVKSTISILGHSFQSSYKNGAEAFILEFCHRLRVSAKIEAEMKGKLIDLINKSHGNAITEAKKSIESIVDQNAVKNLEEDE